MFSEVFWGNQPAYSGAPPLPAPPLHLLIAVSFLGLFYLTYRLATRPTCLRRWLRLVACLLLFEQVMTNLWYFTSPYLVQPLPVFHCRIAKPILIVLCLFLYRSQSKVVLALRRYAATVAFYGALASIAYPSPDPFQFPHWSIFSYYFGHLFLGILAIGLSVGAQENWTWKQVWPIQGITVLVNILTIVVAHLTQSNYGFYLEPPFVKSLPQTLGLVPYTLAIALVYALLAFVSYAVLMKVQKKSQLLSR